MPPHRLRVDSPMGDETLIRLGLFSTGRVRLKNTKFCGQVCVFVEERATVPTNMV